jgi:hypothetical protein
MNDNLENRLRDALDAGARTVPDGPPPDDLATVVDNGGGRRPSTLLIAVAAAAAVVTAITVPYAVRRDSPAPPLQAPCPGAASVSPVLPATPPAVRITGSPAPPTEADRLPEGPPPRVPYTVTDATGAGYLQDGTTRVTLAAGLQVKVIDRLDCSWLVARKKTGEELGTTEFGVLRPSGQFTRLGASVSRAGGLGLSVGLAPDATKVAYTTLTAGNNARLVVLDLATGRELASRQVRADTAVLAWNGRGVWLHHGDGVDRPHRFSRWQPGGELQPVAAPELLYAYRSTDRMLVQQYQGTTACVRVVEPGADGQLADVMKSCLDGSSLGPTLSPAGTVMIHHDGKPRLVPDGTVISVPSGLSPGPYVWEDDDNVLIEVHGIGRRTIVRCQVRTGDCERVYSSPDQSFGLRLVEQNPYRLLGF